MESFNVSALGELAAIAALLVGTFVYALRILTKNQVVLAENINKEIELHRESEDARIAAIQAKLELQRQNDKQQAELSLRMATLTTEIASAKRESSEAVLEINRLKTVNLDMDTAVKQLGVKLAESDDERKALRLENQQLKATIARLEARIIVFEQMEAGFKKLKADFDREVERSTGLQAQLNRKDSQISELTARLDAFESQKALEERPIGKPPVIEMKSGQTVDGLTVTISDIPEGDNAA